MEDEVTAAVLYDAAVVATTVAYYFTYRWMFTAVNSSVDSCIIYKGAVPR